MTSKIRHNRKTNSRDLENELRLNASTSDMAGQGATAEGP